MRLGVVLYNMGKIPLLLSVAMCLPDIYAVIYREIDVLWSLLAAQGIMLAVGLAMVLGFKQAKGLSLRYREGFAMATFGWLLAAVLGAMPYLFSGLCTPVNAWFESMSGYSTTSMTILPAFETIPRSLLIYRNLTHWLGGMGILVLLLMFMPGSSGAKIYKAEVPGNMVIERATPKIGDVARILWVTYVGMTALLCVLLLLCGLNFNDALCYAMAAISTGGFSNYSNGLMSFVDNAAVQWLLVVFMILAGGNFMFHYLSIVKRRNYFWRSEEFRVYLLMMFTAAALLAVSLFYNGTYAGESPAFVIRQAVFHVVSVMTTTGFYTVDYDIWPAFCRMLLFGLFFVGGCAGSTSGSIKVSRLIIAFKSCIASLGKTLQPKLVTVVKLDKKVVSNETINAVTIFLLLYGFLLMLGALVLSWQGLAPFEAISVVMSALSNEGIGFGRFGPSGDLTLLTDFSKLFLSFYMMLGRLEVLTVMVLFTRFFWRK
ncbi:MAG: TrkH family potassium uptake protein [Firmicutes bacterium]|nr:TrkH family potassium uptake protein [Bacillota bacterium]